MANNTITGRDLIDSADLEEQPPIEFPLFADNISHILANDKAAGFALDKLADSLQNGSVVLHTPSEAY